MQVQSRKQTLQSNRPLNSATAFTIEANTKAFEVLSSNLYEDKPEAIVRELSCNALDAQIMAGTQDTPFEIGIPSDINPFFRIRDFGVGLSHDDMVGLYTTYFGSNKRETNSLIGGLGLGSKTPFAYTDSFAVTSYFEGTARQYSVFKGENGNPSITLVNESKTDEHNGLEIIVPVKREDFYTFKEKVAKVLKWFPLDFSQHNVPVVEWEMKNEVYGILLGTQRSYNTNSASLVMGNVQYRITGNALGLNDAEEGKFNWILRNTGFIIFAEIGEIDVAASREALSYDKKSIIKLKEKLRIAVDLFYKDYLREIGFQETFHEQYLKAMALTKIMSVKSAVWTRMLRNTGIETATDSPDLSSRYPYMAKHRWKQKIQKKEPSQRYIELGQNIEFLWAPKPIPRLSKWLAHNKHLFDKDKDLLFLFGPFKQFKNLFFGMFPMHLLILESDGNPLPVAIPVKRTSQTSTKTPVKIYTRDMAMTSHDFYQQSEISKQLMSYSVQSNSLEELHPDISYYWVETEGVKYPWGDDVKRQHLAELWTIAYLFLDPNLQSKSRVLFISKSLTKKAKKEIKNKYQSLKSFLEDIIKKEDVENNVDYYLHLHDFYYDIKNNPEARYLCNNFDSAIIPKNENDPLYDLLRTYRFLISIKNRANILRDKYEIGGYERQNWDSNIERILTRIYAQYPFLKIVSSAYRHSISWEVFLSIKDSLTSKISQGEKHV